MGLFFVKKKTLKNLSTCIKNSLNWTNPNYKLINIFKIHIYIYIYIYRLTQEYVKM